MRRRATRLQEQRTCNDRGDSARYRSDGPSQLVFLLRGQLDGASRAVGGGFQEVTVGRVETKYARWLVGHSVTKGTAGISVSEGVYLGLVPEDLVAAVGTWESSEDEPGAGDAPSLETST